MSKTEQRLADALRAAAGSVPEEILRPLTSPELSANGSWVLAAKRMLTGRPMQASMRRGRTERWLAPVAAAAAIGLVVGAVASLPHLLHGAKPSSFDPGAAPIVGVGGFPTGIAFDQASGTIYVSSGEVNALTMINARTCNATQRSGCLATRRAGTGGGDPIGVAVDEVTHTVYAVNGSSNTVAVIDAATCNAVDSAGCTATPPLIHVGNGPEFLAVDPVTDTIYVANTGAGTVSVINGATCNASDTSGCGKPPASAKAGDGAFPIAVDAATNTVYVGLNNNVAVIKGATCDAAETSGCAHTPAQISAAAPAGIAVDDAHRTVYISGEQGTVTVVDRNACDGANTRGCSGNHATVTIGSDPRGNALVAAADTLYATNAGSNTVSMINTASCNATATAGCASTPSAFPAGSSPRRISYDPATHTVYVVNTGASTLSMINSTTCGAARQSGCPTKSSAGTVGQGGRAGRASGMDSNCSPVETPAASGQPAASFTSASTQLASGSVDGMAWSVWAKKGVAEPTALEDGGVVLNGRWYGLCPGFPNVFEMELANLGAHGIDYGFVAFPGKAQVRLTSGGHVLPAPVDVPLKGASFFIGSLPKSACAYKQMLTHARTSADSSMHQLGFGSCQAGRVVDITGSNGEWGPGQYPWTMAGLRLAPASSYFGSGGGGGGSLVNSQDQCSAAQTTSDSGTSAASTTRSMVRVASGTSGTMPWSLWASKTGTGVVSVEQGGLVVNGRWYGMCPGAPNPAEFELLDVGQTGLIYGYVANPGPYRIHLSASVPAPRLFRVRGGTFFIGTLPRSACDYRTVVLDAINGGEDDMHTFNFGQPCSANQLVTTSGGFGTW